MRLNLIFLLTLLIGISCKNEKPTIPQEAEKILEIQVQPVFGGQNLFLDSIYTTAEGYDVKFSEIKFYAENINNGGVQLIDAALFDYRERGLVLIETKGDFENFSAINANLGVGSAFNNNDPAAFENESMLNIVNSNDMHWDWSVGYIFMKVEAKVDTIQDAIPLFDHNVVFHIGNDVNLQTISFNNLNWLDQGNKHILPLKLDMMTFLQNGTEIIDLKNEFSSHTAPGQESLSLKVISNFNAALTPF